MSSKTKNYLLGGVILLIGVGCVFLFILDLAEGVANGTRTATHITRDGTPFAFYLNAVLRLVIGLICLFTGTLILRAKK